MALTGKQRFRTNWRGKLILQVQENYTATENCGPFIDCYPAKRWRDATVQDLNVKDMSHD